MAQSNDWAWEPEEFGRAHRGRAAAVLAGGAEPEPVYLDFGSGSNVHSSSHWSLYTGESPRRPCAVAVRGACLCGWRAPRSHPLDGDRRAADPRGQFDVEDGPYRDWADHITAVGAAAAPIPDPVAATIAALAEQLAALADGGPVAALRVVGVLERLTADVGRRAVRAIDVGDDADGDEHTWSGLAAGLGVTEPAARTWLLRWCH